jgi:cellulose 1,4-beta-cellobiosidase
MTRRIVSCLAVFAAAMCITLVGQAPAHAAASKPSGLRATEITYDTASLAWDASSGRVLYYLIYRDGLWVGSTSSTSGVVRDLTPGKTHTIGVRARSTDYSLSDTTTITVTTLSDSGPPSAPQNLRVVTDAAGSPSGFAWDTSVDDRGIRAYVLYADGSDSFNSGNTEASFYTLTDEYCTVQHGQAYTFTVRAVDLSGNLSTAVTSLTVTVP